MHLSIVSASVFLVACLSIIIKKKVNIFLAALDVYKLHESRRVSWIQALGYPPTASVL